MKNLIVGVCALLASSFAYADFDVDIYGRVEGVGEQSVVLSSFGKSVEVMVSPFTKIEIEVRGLLHYDYPATFNDVRVGDRAKVEAVPNGYGEFYAKEIELVR